MSAGGLALSLAAAALALWGCADDACKGGTPSMEITITLRSGVARSEIASLVANVKTLGRLKGVELSAEKLRQQGKATVVIVAGPQGAGGFRVEVQIVAKDGAGRTVARGTATLDGSGDACNFYSLLLIPQGMDDAGPPLEDSSVLDQSPKLDQRGQDLKGALDGKPLCSPLLCAGCCNSIGVCMSGDKKTTCGKGGGRCNNCVGLSEQTVACVKGVCQTCGRGMFSCGGKDACTCVGRCSASRCVRTCNSARSGQCGSIYHQCKNGVCSLCPAGFKNCDRFGDCGTPTNSAC